MPYMIDATDRPGAAELRTKIRPEHLKFLDASVGRLLACGAKLSDDGETALGSLYILDTDSRAEAKAFIDSDPFARNGVFGTITITRWRKGYFNFAKVQQPPAR